MMRTNRNSSKHNFSFLSDQSLIRKISKRQVDSNVGDSLKIFGFNVIEADKAEMEHGIPVLKAGSKVTLRLFGNGFTKQTTIGLTSEPHEIGAKCIKIVTDMFKVNFKLNLKERNFH